ncbi:DUF481 domain-containing protein [Pseudohaliea sp.]|uniref:DUF481 domain-containing protein n=1 Tax=Pseudohaliea sp. TaxID=2740289 RepID=UPI0032EABC16
MSCLCHRLRRSLLYSCLNALAALCLLGIAGTAAAHPKTDTLVLYNGDRLTGEIQALRGGLVSFGTDAMGTVEVEWKEVASVESRYYYEIRLASGERFYGAVGPGEQPGAITLREGSDNRSIAWDELVELRPIEKEALDRLDIYTSLNFAYTRASNVSTSELKADISYEDERSLNRLTARNTVTTTQEETSSSQRLNLSRQLWTDRATYFRLLSGSFESNDELGLDRRFTIGAGIGRYFIDTQRSTLSGYVTLRALEEFGEDGENTESLESEFAIDYGVWRFDSPDLDLRYSLSLFPSLTESGRLRGETELRLRWEIYRDLFWDVSAWGSFDNQALDENADRATDWGLTTGVGWEF